MLIDLETLGYTLLAIVLIFVVAYVTSIKEYLPKEPP